MDIDPRGHRFGAVITTAGPAVVLITDSAWRLGAQLLPAVPVHPAEPAGPAIRLVTGHPNANF